MMNFKQNLTVLFWLYRQKAKADGKAPIYARITIDGKYTEISTGKKVNPASWDLDVKQVIGSGLEVKLANQKLAQLQTDVERIFNGLQTQFSEVTPAMVKNVYLGKPAVEQSKVAKPAAKNELTLLEVFDEFIAKFEKRVERENASYETLKHWRSTKKKVAGFIKYHFDRQDILFSSLGDTFADDLYDYLTLHVAKPLAEVTARKEVKWVRQIVKIGVKKKYIPSNPMEGFKCSGGDVEVIPLEFWQVEKIQQKQFSVDRISEVRDAFIFQCFTGFAYQDIYDLSPENVVLVGPRKERWLVKHRGKTEVGEMVPILPIVDQLISKYQGHPYCLANRKLIPVNSNYRYNVYLKDIAQLCEIRDVSGGIRRLDTHDARHFFADMMLNNGVPLEDVSKMLGHKSIRTTMRYCRVRKSRISANVALVRNKLFTKTGKFRQAS
ncbi:site-specific integrase [Dyadobacter soli]|nr:site-specific integrase [Dyadobacter soli]